MQAKKNFISQSTRILFTLLLIIAVQTGAYAQKSSSSSPSGGASSHSSGGATSKSSGGASASQPPASIGAANTATGDANDSNPGTAWDIRKNYFLRFPAAREFGPVEAGGQDVIKDKKSMGPGVVTHCLSGPVQTWPVVIPCTTSEVPTLRDQAITQDLLRTFGYPVSDTQFQLIQRYDDNRLLEQLFDPEKLMWLSNAVGGIQATSVANSAANLARNQATTAIERMKQYLDNFTVQPKNVWNTIRDRLFVPMAILLLLPGAVLAQVKVIVQSGSPVLGEAPNPFEGIIRSIVGLFFIFATYLVVNWGIDVGNSIAYTIQSEYTRLFHSDMYKDAACAQARAFPIRPPQSNENAMNGSAFGSGGGDAYTAFEKLSIDITTADPCTEFSTAGGAGKEDRKDEYHPMLVATQRASINSANALLTGTWDVMSAFQLAYLLYLFCMGPIVAALWVWPLQTFRGALGSWIEGVVVLCFWSLFWNTTILLMACFRGVNDTGTIIMTALNVLANFAVKYAFDFGSLVSAAAARSSSSPGVGSTALGAGKAAQSMAQALGGQKGAGTPGGKAGGPTKGSTGAVAAPGSVGTTGQRPGGKPVGTFAGGQPTPGSLVSPGGQMSPNSANLASKSQGATTAGPGSTLPAMTPGVTSPGQGSSVNPSALTSQAGQTSPAMSPSGAPGTSALQTAGATSSPGSSPSLQGAVVGGGFPASTQTSGVTGSSLQGGQAGPGGAFGSPAGTTSGLPTSGQQASWQSGGSTAGASYGLLGQGSNAISGGPPTSQNGLAGNLNAQGQGLSPDKNLFGAQLQAGQAVPGTGSHDLASLTPLTPGGPTSIPGTSGLTGSNLPPAAAFELGLLGAAISGLGGATPPSSAQIPQVTPTYQPAQAQYDQVQAMQQQQAQYDQAQAMQQQQQAQYNQAQAMQQQQQAQYDQAQAIQQQQQAYLASNQYATAPPQAPVDAGYYAQQNNAYAPQPAQPQGYAAQAYQQQAPAPAPQEYSQTAYYQPQPAAPQYTQPEAPAYQQQAPAPAPQEYAQTAYYQPQAPAPQYVQSEAPAPQPLPQIVQQPPQTFGQVVAGLAAAGAVSRQAPGLSPGGPQPQETPSSSQAPPSTPDQFRQQVASLQHGINTAKSKEEKEEMARRLALLQQQYKDQFFGSDNMA